MRCGLANVSHKRPGRRGEARSHAWTAARYCPGVDANLGTTNASPQTRTRGPNAGRLWSPDVAAVALFLILALTVTARLWLAGGSAVTAHNSHDYVLFAFFFSHAVESVAHLSNPLFTWAMNAPYGVNLMANTAFLGVTLPLVPVTALFGPGVAYTLAITLSLAGTATAWYFVLRRHVTAHRSVAFASAAFCGFAPALVGHANGHPNLAAQFMLPLIVSGVIRLRETERPVRSGIVVGLMITYQLFLNEELLLFTALACAVMVMVYAASRPAQARTEAVRFARGFSVAAGVSLLLTAYPLWFQFFGPQHYRGPFGWAASFSTDLAAYPAFATNSLAGQLGVAPSGGNPVESNAFLGLPLCLLALGAAVALWRVLVARIAAVVAAVFALSSLGDTIVVLGRSTGIPGPWRLVSSLPLFDSVIVSRLALVVVGAVGVLIAVAGDRVLSSANEAGSGASRRRLVWYAALVAALLPIAPTPLWAQVPPPVPTFFTAGTWRQFVTSGSVVPVPPDVWSDDALRWLVATQAQLRVADGYFLGPQSADSPVATFGPPSRPTSLLLLNVASTGTVPSVTPGMRQMFLDDLRFWRADALVLGPRGNREALRTAVDTLVGRGGVEVDDVWVWDVRDLVRTENPANP